jgi:outer membrane protein assembly factor BamB
MRALALSLLLVSTTASSIAHARTWAPRSDVEIIAVDLATGALKWSYAAKTGNAHFEMFANVLVAYPHYDNQDKTNPIFLDPKTGAILKGARVPKTAPLKASSAQWLRGSVVLPNGWRNDDFRSGYITNIDFRDKKKKVVWTIPQKDYPDRIVAYKDHVLVVNGQRDVATIDAYKAGAKTPTWTVDFNTVLGRGKTDRLSRVSMELVGDVLYSQSDQYVFAIDPATGKVAWKVDAAAAAGIRYDEMYGGALDVAVFSREADTLVASFEKRVFALDAKTGALKWHLDPDTFPHAAFPLAHDGVVYLTAGPARKLAVKAKP